jgi:hypothetical protein
MGASDDQVKIDRAEAIGAGFYSKREIDRIVTTEKITPWLRDGWKIARETV